MRLVFSIILALFWGYAQLYSKVINVSPKGSDTNNGCKEFPIATISKAAQIALADDTIMIHEGIYREWVSPENSGINNSRRIVYMAVPGEEVIIKGSEIVKNWTKEKKDIWKVKISNDFFGDFNPFSINVTGDWLTTGHNLHLGEVYLNEQPLTEVTSKEELKENCWFVEWQDDYTYIYANFADNNPNKNLTEINVRPACFFPKKTGINYITVKGLKLSQAATQWSAPTSEQFGLIGPNWSKGWIIEDCEVSYSKCVGICLGKERASGHNMWSLYRNKFGYMKCGFNREIEAILKAVELGWDKNNIGSHIVRRNIIHDCGQAGIVGHMGGAFCTISENEIYNINQTAGKITGAETAGIKLHAAIDTKIENNFIRTSTRGIWLDWQAQGTQVYNNIFYDSDLQDLFIEVSHGPTMIYNNLFLSKQNLLVNSQGVALFNNLFSGGIKLTTSPERYTPYHVAHSTKVKGFFENTGGDVRFYNNIFLSYNHSDKEIPGLAAYNEYPVYSEDMFRSVSKTPEYLVVKFPIWSFGNIYFKNGKPFNKETGNIITEQEGKYELKRDDKGWFFSMTYPENINEVNTFMINTSNLGQTFISESVFENPDGTSFILEKDFNNNDRGNKPVCGPFELYNDQYIWKCK